MSPFHDDFFNRFFEDFFGEMPEREFKRNGLGSGVLIDNRGYVLTNEHVVQDANKMTVTLPDGREFKATLAGTDPRSDLAVIKIDASNLPVATLGDSDNLKIGEWVVAIGNPFGNLMSDPEPTVTTGVVSALNRTLPNRSRTDKNYSGLIQTDAAINPGNSGGPLVNLYGEVIGINVAIFSTSGGYQGIGFAIPVNTAKRIVESLIEGKEVHYGWIGVSIQEIDNRLADYFKLPNTEGVLVLNVLENGPAQDAGIKEGDIIVSIDNKKVTNVSSLINQIGISPVGQKVNIEIMRDGKKQVIPTVVKKRPKFDEFGNILEENAASNQNGDEQPGGPELWRGIKVAEITDDTAQQLSRDTKQGVIVSYIEPQSPAAEAGLRRGDVIVSINRVAINTIDDFNKVTKGIKGNSLVQTSRGFIVISEKSD